MFATLLMSMRKSEGFTSQCFCFLESSGQKKSKNIFIIFLINVLGMRNSKGHTASRFSVRGHNLC